MKFGIFKVLTLLFGTLLLTSCLQERYIAPVASTQSWFEGVRSAKNKGGSPPSILIEWNRSSLAVTAYRVYSVVYDAETKKNQLSLLKEVQPDVSSYLYSNELIPGAVYSFIVRAVDAAGVEDTNTTQASTVAFNGISAIRINGPTTATAYLDTSLGAFDEIRVYAQPENESSPKVKVASATGDVSSIEISGLRSGVKYKFFVSAYMSYLNAEDGNELYVTGQTHSSSFGSGLASEDISKYSYRGMLSVQAYGDAPNAPVPPTSRMVRLTWLAFGGASSTTKYKVIRADETQTPDTATTTNCTATTNTSCVVATCTNVGTGIQSCEDTQVAAAPKTYNYVVTLVKTDLTNGETWAEELPPVNASDFYTKVAIPPPYMVLVQRDAANYEMCLLLGSSSVPRKHQRCSYAGIAGSPYNRGPGKPPLNMEAGYYDFGYNLFVDRYQTGCNWTRNSSACGPDGCIGITSATSSSAAPADGLGTVGDVYFAINGGWGNNCYYKKPSGWVIVGDPNNGLTSEQIASAITIDPKVDKKTPTINGFTQQSAFNTCNAQSTEYGNKRLLRRREYVQVAAFPTIAGEKDAITDRVEESYLRQGRFDTTNNLGGQQDGFNRCASGGESSRLQIPTTLAELLAPTNHRTQVDSGVNPYLNAQSKPYFIGTYATSKCITRWGSQDVIPPSGTGSNAILSDTFVRTNDVNSDPAQFAPVDSDYDSGVVKDWSNAFFTYQLNGTIGPAWGTSGQWSVELELNASGAGTYQSFILPLGMPLVPANNTSAIYSAYKQTMQLVYSGVLGGAQFGAGSNVKNNLVYRNSSLASIGQTRYLMMQGMQHRFSYSMHPDQHTTRFATWCAIEAE